MTTRPLRRMAVALAAAGALVAMMGSPVSAASYNANITSGTLTLTTAAAPPNNNPQNVSLGSGAGNCPAGTLTADVTTTTIEVTALSNKGQFTFSGGTYIAELSLLYSSVGTVSGTTISSNLAIGVNADIYVAGSNCTNGTQVCDDLQTEITLGGSLSNTPPLSTGNTASLVGSDTIALTTASFCNAPFASYINGHVTITGAAPLVATII